MSTPNAACIRPLPSPPVELSVKNLQKKSKKKKLVYIQTTKPPKNSVKIRPEKIPTHFHWALVLTITCFFVIGPCWALYKIHQLRQLITDNDFDKARQLSTKISSILVISTIIGAFTWVSFLFCSVGLFLTGFLLEKNYI